MALKVKMSREKQLQSIDGQLMSVLDMIDKVEWAAENVKILLDAGADASVKGTDGMTAWDYAENNEKLKGTDVYWILNEARFK